MKEPLVELRGAGIWRGQAPVLRGVDLSVEPGCFVCIRGRSGSGKTSLLRVLALIDRPREGRIIFMGKDVTGAPDGLLAKLRLESIGYIPQTPGLIEELSVAENIALPLLAMGLPWDEALERAEHYARLLGIDDLLDRSPATLSGGQRQRASIARALAKQPRLLVADEPLSSLDDELALRVLWILRGLASTGAAVVYATPDMSEEAPCTHEYIIRDGRLVEL